MAHNPLLGSRISLISKKNIRYEGTLYSINEQDATVALQNVRAYGTEGRESESETFVPPQDTIHPYLLFRGCDIKDLHVHENQQQQQQQADNDIPEDPAIVSSEQPNSSSGGGGGGGDEVAKQEETEKSNAATTSEERTKTSTEEPDESAKDKSAQEDNQATTTENDEVARDQNENNSNRNNETKPQAKSESNADESEPLSKSNKPNRSSNNNRRKKNTNPKKMVGSGASLLNRKVRGVVDGDNGPENANEKNFDFESNLAEFSKTNDDVEEDEDVDEDENAAAYNKDDFFDSISCDVSDRQNGIDNRLRGREERSLNTETFGATSLGYGGRRGNNRRYRGGGRGGRGRGRGRRGGGRGRGSMPRENNRWKEGLSHGGGRHGDRKTYGDGGLSANRNAGAQ